MYAVPYTFLSLSAVLGSLLSRLHWVTVWSQQKQEKHAGAQNCSTTFVVCLLLERLKNPAECPGWWQLDFGVTFEACPSTHSPRGTHVSYVQPHNSLCLPGPGDPQPTPVAWEKNLQIFKVNTAMSRDIGTYRRTMLKEAPAGTKHQSMNWNRIVCYSKR